MTKNLSTRKSLNHLLQQLKLERASFESHWRELAANILPRRIRFTTTDRNRGDKRNQAIKEETAVLASRTLRAGMMGGITSPSRPWFNLDVAGSAATAGKDASLWLHEVTKIIRSIYVKTNLYQALPTLYADFSTFGTGVMGIEEDIGNDVLRFTNFPLGSYYIAQDDRGVVNTFAREFEMTVWQTVEKFGTVKDGHIVGDTISQSTKLSWDREHYESWVKILHVVRPNKEYNPDNPLSKKYQSIYVEQVQNSNTVLRDSGFDYFPILAPRWELSGEDIYGTSCPGMEALPSIKQLQIMEKRGLQAIEKMINPPMQAPTHLRQQKVSVIPGDVTYMDIRQGNSGFQPIYQINYDLSSHEAKVEQVRERVKKAFFEDLFLMFQSFQGRDRVTAVEIDARSQEKLLILGPVLERLNQDLLNPLIKLTFLIASSQGLIPLPPDSLQGQGLKIDYISIMHQAQKSLGLAPIDRLKQHAAEVGQLSPSALDKINFDKMTDEYADILGVPPSLIMSDDEVLGIREVRLKQQQAEQQAAVQQQQAELQIKATEAQAKVQASA